MEREGVKNILSKIEAHYFECFITQSDPTNSQPLVENVDFDYMKASCMPIKSAKVITVLQRYLKDAFHKNPFERILCLYVCTPDPQKVIGIIKNVRANVPKKMKSFKA